MHKKTFIILVVLLMFAFLNNPIYASDTIVEDINEKVDNQTQEMVDKAKTIEVPTNTEDIDRVIDTFNKSQYNRSQGSGVIQRFRLKVLEGFFHLGLVSRQYAVPFYMFIITYNVVMMSIFGAKSLVNRKKYIVGSLLISLLFVILINVPLIMLYFRAKPLDEALSLDNMLAVTYSITFFLRKHSIAICMMLLLYGVINRILGKNDVPRSTSGKFYSKTAVVIFIVLQTLPHAINFII